MNKYITEERFDHHGMTVHLVPGQKRKTVQLAVKFKAPLNRETITKRSLLTSLLEQGTKQYPSLKQLMQYLDELYGSVLSVEGQKKGNHHIVTVRLEVINKKFIEQGTAMMSKAIELLHDIIFEPHQENDTFPEKVVTREKRSLHDKIEAIQDNKLALANMRLIDHMCQDERYSIHARGYLEDLPNIDAKVMSDYHKTMLKEDAVDFYIAGDIDPQEMTALVKDKFTAQHAESQQFHFSEDQEDQRTKDVNEIVEVQQINQAKLHIGFRTNITYQDEAYFALHVFNGLFGGFPSSKLFMNVREKHSLAYYAASRIESHKGLLIVYSGIQANDYQKARDIIELQLQEMIDGQFTETEVENTKELLMSEIEDTLDHLGGTIELLYQQVVGRKEMPPQEFIDGISKVSKEDVVQVAKQITADTVFLLTNREEEPNEQENI